MNAKGVSLGPKVVLDLPTIAPSTAVIAETPVADVVALSTLAMPAISVSTSVT